MYLLRPDTLAYLKQSQLFKTVDRTNVPVPQFVQHEKAYRCGAGSVNVEESALRFYMMNHAWTLIQQQYDPNEPLPFAVAEVARAYVDSASIIAQRLIAYTFLVITRESRHLHSNSGCLSYLKSKSQDYYNFWCKIASSGSDGAVSKVENMPPDIGLGVFTDLTTYLFNNGNFSGGYGGKPWGNIANALRSFIFGETSAEAFSDTAWTLAHNNGPMFNKGMLYDHYSNDLYKILDVQRAGMIPQLVGEVVSGNYHLSGVTSSLKCDWSLCRNAIGSDFDGYVDWEQVEALGSMKKYPAEKKAQIAKFGPSKSAKEAMELEAKKFYITDTEFAIIKQRQAA